MDDREGLLEVMALWGQLPLTAVHARQTDAESLTDAILASDWLASLKARLRADAWDEALVASADAFFDGDNSPIQNPYRKETK